MTENILRLSAVCKEMPVVLQSPDGDRDLVLKELIGTDRDKYMTKLVSRIRIDPKSGKAVGMKTFEGFQTELLKISLFENGELVSKEFIEELPASTQQVLFEKAQKLSGLDAVVEDEDKEDPNE